MRKKIMTLALLSLLLVGCNKVSDTEVSENGKNSETGGNITDTSTTDKDTDKETSVDKENLYKEFRKGFDAFFEYNQDVTYECLYTASATNLDETEDKMKSMTKGTIDRTNGVALSIDHVYATDPTTNTDIEVSSTTQYIGASDGNYSYYVADGSDRIIYEADKSYVNYFYTDRVIEYFGLDEMNEVFEGAKDFATSSAALKYCFSYMATDITTDISKTEEGIVFSFDLVEDNHDDYYFSKIAGGYSYTVKDGWLTKIAMHSTEYDHYPNGKKKSEIFNMEVSFSKGFDDTFYKSFTDTSSYTASVHGAPFSIDVYYEDYYYTTLSCYIGEDISCNSYTSEDKIDGMYFERDYKTAYTEKRCSSDMTALYVKLKTMAPTTNAIIYALTEKTTLYYDNVFPTSVSKRLSIQLANPSYVGYGWEHTDQDERELANETMTVNGVTTTDDGITVQAGVVYLIKHTYSTYRS